MGTIGISLFGSSSIGLLLLITHILGSLTVGILFRFWKKNKSTNQSYSTSQMDNKLQNVSLYNLGEALSESISSALSTIFMIGGFVVLFSVIISVLNKSGITNIVLVLFEPVCNLFNVPSSISSSLFIGILEITNGISLLAGIKLKQISINIVLCSFLLGTGGISVLLQVLSIVSKSDLSIKPYIIGKILHGLIAAFYTYLLIRIFPVFNLNF